MRPRGRSTPASTKNSSESLPARSSASSIRISPSARTTRGGAEVLRSSRVDVTLVPVELGAQNGVHDGSEAFESGGLVTADGVTELDGRALVRGLEGPRHASRRAERLQRPQAAFE